MSGDVVDFARARAARGQPVGAETLELECNCGAGLFAVRVSREGVKLVCPRCGQDMTGALDVRLD